SCVSVSDGVRAGLCQATGPRARRVLGALVVAEVALSLVLLAGAGLLIRSFVALQNVNPGMRTDGVLTTRVTLPSVRYREDRAIYGFYNDAIARIAAVPGVESVAGVTFLPM